MTLSAAPTATACRTSQPAATPKALTTRTMTAMPAGVPYKARRRVLQRSERENSTPALKRSNTTPTCANSSKGPGSCAVPVSPPTTTPATT